ncbi:dimethyl sulfoxide reductase DmsA [Clostridiales bacterium]|nr:dimethyl sulfoxide reductase DmsA [Clostridiales bacterium]
MTEKVWKKTICPYDCPTTCGFLVETDGEKILKVKGDPTHPASQGLICRKMRNYEKSVNSKDRILKPMIRRGKKGESSFKEINWSEALKIISDRWKEIIDENGPEAIAYCSYSGVMSDVQRRCGEAFFNYMGACELVQTLCSSAKGVGYANVMGSTGCLDPRELKDSDFYVVWGANMTATRIQSMPDIINAKNSGKRIVLIEVYGEPMSKYCDDTLLIKPGSDGALALALMHVLVREGLADEEFLRKNTEGYDEFRETLPEYTPEWAEEKTGISVEAIERLAIDYGNAKAPVIILGSGNSRYKNGAMTIRLITILSHFTGAWQKKGGGLCGCSPTGTAYIDLNIIKRPDFKKTKGKKININQLGAAINDSSIKSLYVYGGNPANSVSDTKAVIEGLKREDIFTVVHERFMTDTAKYADIILPATFSVEQSDIYEAYGYCTLATAYKIIEPPAECKTNWDTFCMLAEAMGYDNEYFKSSAEEMMKKVLNSPTEAVRNLPEEKRKTLLEGGAVSMPFADHCKWKTKIGKIQIINNKLATPMPAYEECYGGEQPLRLVSVPSEYTLNSIFTQRNDLTEPRGTMRLAVHRIDAEKRGIKNGDRIVCFNDLAEVEFEALVTENIAVGAVAAIGIYKADQTFCGLGVNALQHDRLSDLGEATTMNDNTVDIRLV